MVRFILAALALGFASPVSISSQQASPAPVRLAPPDATLQEAFSSVRGVRELASGKILVADWIEERIALVDLGAGTVEDLVTVGAGPDEVRLPAALVPMTDDSTLIVDLGNSRLSVLGPGGRIARTIRADSPGMGGVHGVASDGALHFAVPAWAERAGALTDDSVRLVRMDPATAGIRQVAVLQGSRSRSDIRSPSMTPRIPIVGYASQDAWTLSDAGNIVIVRGGDYHVDVIRADGTRRAGPSYAEEPRRVTDADRRAFVEDFLRTTPTSGRGPDGGMGHSPSPDEAEIVRFMSGTEFAERHPHFKGGPIAAPGGGVWVARSGTLDAPVIYDVFDDAGRRARVVELAPGRRVMAVGRRGVYAVVETEFGLQTLERYPLPR